MQMSIAISTIRPGLLVSLKTTVSGNVSYARRDVDPDHYEGDGTRRAVWETERVITDPTEHEAAIKVRSKARIAILRHCSPSSFGLLCPQAKAEDLSAAIDEARDLCRAFNARSALSKVNVFVVAGRIAQDDVEAVRAINSEIRDLLQTMEQGVARLDVTAIRDAANKARGLASMLTPDAAERAQKAIEVARRAARAITKAGDAAALEVDAATIATLRDCQRMFLDLDNATEIAAPIEQGRAVDFQAIGDLAMPPAVAPSLELN